MTAPGVQCPGRQLTRAGQPMPPTRLSTSSTSCTPMGAILVARYATAGTGQPDTSHRRAVADRPSPAAPQHDPVVSQVQAWVTETREVLAKRRTRRLLRPPPL